LSIRKAVDDTLNGDIRPEAGTEPALRALVRAVRVCADGIDDIERRLDVATTRIVQLGGGIIVAVISAAILLALQK